MPNIKIEVMIAIDGFILVVYHLHRNYYQFSIIDELGEVIDFSEIFYTCEAAKGKGKSVIRTLSK